MRKAVGWVLAAACAAAVLVACSGLGLYTRGALRSALQEEGFATEEDLGRVEARAGELSDSWWKDLVAAAVAAAIGGSGLAVGYTRMKRGPSHKAIIPQIVAKVEEVAGSSIRSPGTGEG